MKTRLFIFKESSSEHGFIVMPVVIIGIVLSIVGGILMIFFNTQNKQFARNRILDEIDHLNTSIVMIFSDPTACMANQAAGFFGTTLSALSSLSGGGSIQLRYPNSPAPSKGIMLRSGGMYRTLQINRVSFSTPRLVPTPVTNPPVTERSYLADLTIEAKDGDGSRKTSIPFYFITNAGGTLIRCFATTYPKPNFVVPITLEDAVCRQWKREQNVTLGPTEAYYYAPEQKTCFRGTASAALPE